MIRPRSKAMIRFPWAGCLGILLAGVIAAGEMSGEAAEGPGSTGLLRNDDAVSVAPPGARKIWVFFGDKRLRTRREYDRAIQEVAAEYDPRAVARRRLRRTAPGLFDIHDVPVPRAYVDAVLQTGAKLSVTSRWLNAISVYATGQQFDAIARLEFVDSIQPVNRGRRAAPTAGNAGDPGNHRGPGPAGFFSLMFRRICSGLVTSTVASPSVMNTIMYGRPALAERASSAASSA